MTITNEIEFVPQVKDWPDVPIIIHKPCGHTMSKWKFDRGYHLCPAEKCGQPGLEIHKGMNMETAEDVIKELKIDHLFMEDAELTYLDVATALVIVKDLNPDDYISPIAKKAIKKIKAHFKPIIEVDHTISWRRFQEK